LTGEARVTYYTNMTKTSDKTKPGWAIPTTVKDDFVDFCANMGTLAQEDCAGALFLWLQMPPQIREWAKLAAKGAPVVAPEFWADWKAGLEKGIAELLQTHREKESE